MSLGSLEASGGARGAEAGATRCGEPIDDARDERTLGSHDGQIDALTLGEAQQAPGVGRRDIDVEDFRFERRACVPRGDEYPIHAPRLRAFPCERMFTAAAADDQDLHQWRK